MVNSELCVHWGGGAFKNGDIFKTQGNLLSRGVNIIKIGKCNGLKILFYSGAGVGGFGLGSNNKPHSTCHQSFAEDHQRENQATL